MLFLQGSNLDSNAKMWRLVADLMNDLGTSLFLICVEVALILVCFNIASGYKFVG